MSKDAIKKLPPRLRRMVKTLEEAAAAPPPPALMAARAPAEETKPEEPCIEPYVHVTVTFTGDIADLLAVGFVDPKYFPKPDPGAEKVATGGIPPGRLADLAAIDHVTHIAEPRRDRPLLNNSVKTIRARQYHTGTPHLTGKGVVIGIMDSGIDWRHGDFRRSDADGTSRILGIWDQQLTAEAGETAGPTVNGSPNGIGVIYDKQWIKEALAPKPTKKIRTKDSTKEGDDGAPAEEGHGTHVAGIAAGDGSPNACCSCSASEYVGVAPDAEFLVVRLGPKGGKEAGLDWIAKHDEVKEKPLVVNYSLGGNYGPHDGTDPFERTIKDFVQTKSSKDHPRVMVIAAGNSAIDKRHMQVMVPQHAAGAAGLEVRFQVKANNPASELIDLWFDDGHLMELQVVAPGNHATVVQPIGTNMPTPFVVPNDDGTAPDADHSVKVDIGTYPGQPGNNAAFGVDITQAKKRAIPEGEWILRIFNRNPAAGDVKVDGWITDHGGLDAPFFLQNVSNKTTITTPSTSEGAIAVANHLSKTDCCEDGPEEGINETSGTGPVRKGALVKPDLAAPGTEITSAKYIPVGDCTCCKCCECCTTFYTNMMGTSMAAPHVTGAVALLLELDPKMTHADVVKYIRDSLPAQGLDPDLWGKGKLDVQKSVEAYQAAHPPPAPAPARVAAPPSAGIAAPPSAVASDLPPPAEARPPFEMRPLIDLLRDRVKAIPNGELAAALVSHHLSEVRRLINHNQKVAAMWHRADGPRMLRRLFAGGFDTAAAAPIQNAEQREYLGRLFEQLDRFGSPRLKASIASYQPIFLEMLSSPLAAQVG
jgi:subtilisin family serine protease